MKWHQLSDHQRALLGVLYLRARSIGELKVRWAYAVRTLRACMRHGLVTTIPPGGALRPIEGGMIVGLTVAGHELLDEAADETELEEVVT